MFLVDPVHGDEWKVFDNDLRHGSDMVKLIRDNFDDYFTICVAGA